MATGVVVSWCLVLRPNADELIYCYADGVIAWGAPLNLLTDNGWGFAAQQFTGGKRHPFSQEDERRLRSVADETGTVPHFCWPFNPGSKPPESWFRVFALNVSKLFHAQGVYVGDSPKSRPEDLYRKLRTNGVDVPTLEGVREIIGRFIENVWNQQSKRALGGRSPREAFFEDNPIPKRTLAEHEVRYKLMPRTHVKVGRGGTVMLDGIKYDRGTVKSSTVLFDRQGKEVEIRWDRDRSRVFVHELNGKFLCEARDDRLYGVSDKDIKELRREQKAARKHCRDVLPKKKFADTDLAVQAMMRAQERFVAEQNKGRKVVGAELQRPLQLLPGASELIDALPMPRSGGVGGRDAVHPLDAAPLPAGRDVRFVNPLDAAPEPEWPVTDDVPSRRMELPDDWENPLDRLPDLPASDPDDDPAVA